MLVAAQMRSRQMMPYDEEVFLAATIGIIDAVIARTPETAT
jgi:hypothetical protein